jgi:hypothetical protein
MVCNIKRFYSSRHRARQPCPVAPYSLADRLT